MDKLFTLAHLARHIWGYVWTWPPEPGVCLIAATFVATLMTLKSPERPFPTWQKILLSGLVALLLFGEIYALQHDRESYDNTHKSEFESEMGQLKVLFNQTKFLENQESQLKSQVSTSRFEAIIQRHTQARIQVDRLVSQIQVMQWQHLQSRGNADERYSEELKHAEGDEANAIRAEKIQKRQSEDDRFEKEYEAKIVPQLDALVRLLLIDLGRADEAKSKNLGPQFGIKYAYNADQAILSLRKLAEGLIP